MDKMAPKEIIHSLEQILDTIIDDHFEAFKDDALRISSLSGEIHSIAIEYAYDVIYEQDK